MLDWAPLHLELESYSYTLLGKYLPIWEIPLLSVSEVSDKETKRERERERESKIRVAVADKRKKKNQKKKKSE